MRLNKDGSMRQNSKFIEIKTGIEVRVSQLRFGHKKDYFVVYPRCKHCKEVKSRSLSEEKFFTEFKDAEL